MNKTMKTWHFDIKLGNGQVVSIDAYTFEQAFAMLKLDHHWFEGCGWSLVGVEDKIPEPDPTAEEIKKQSEALWSKIEWKKLDEAQKTLEAGYEAFKTAMEFDGEHQDVLCSGPSYAEGKCQLEAAEKCIEYANRWLMF